jgi:hypothetical protein
VNFWIITFNVTVLKLIKLHSCNEFTFICAKYILHNKCWQSWSTSTYMGNFLSQVYLPSMEASNFLFKQIWFDYEISSLRNLIGIMPHLWVWVYMGIRGLITLKNFHYGISLKKGEI